MPSPSLSFRFLRALLLFEGEKPLRGEEEYTEGIQGRFCGRSPTDTFLFVDRLVISSSAFRLSLSFFKGGKRVMVRVVAGSKGVKLWKMRVKRDFVRGIRFNSRVYYLCVTVVGIIVKNRYVNYLANGVFLRESYLSCVSRSKLLLELSVIGMIISKCILGELFYLRNLTCVI